MFRHAGTDLNCPADRNLETENRMRSSETVYARRSDIVLRREFPGRSVLFDPAGGDLFSLNSNGLMIWQRLDGKRNPDELAELLIASDGVSASRAKVDLHAFLNALLAHNLIEPGDGGPVERRTSPAPVSDSVMCTPRTLDVAVTGRCNLGCAYCSHFTGPGDVGEDLDCETWLRFFEELGQNGVMHVILQGGEPFMREDIGALIQGVVKNRMRFSLLSNGTLIDRKTAEIISESGRCNGVQVSIDGLNAEAHDAFRGPGSYSAAVAGISQLMNCGIFPSVRVTLHSKNVDQLSSLIPWLIEDMKVSSVSVNEASFLGRCRVTPHRIRLSVHEKSRAMVDLIRLRKRYGALIEASAGPLANAINWSAMEKARLEKKPPSSGGGSLSACGGVWDTLGVRSDGVMVPCLQMSHIELGTILQDGLVAIWQQNPKLARIRNRRHIPLTRFAECRECRYMPYCTGNCPALAFNLSGQEDRPSHDACYRRFRKLGGRLPDDTAGGEYLLP
jgi:SynChlorMet cassette radical SAM/SPASM protein ScmE